MQVDPATSPSYGEWRRDLLNINNKSWGFCMVGGFYIIVTMVFNDLCFDWWHFNDL